MTHGPINIRSEGKCLDIGFRQFRLPYFIFVMKSSNTTKVGHAAEMSKYVEICNISLRFYTFCTVTCYVLSILIIHCTYIR